MASVKLTLDRRDMKKDGTFPLRIQVSHTKSINLSVSTGISLLPEQWCEEQLSVVAHPAKAKLNAIITKQLSVVRVLLLEKAADGTLSSATSSTLRKEITELIRPNSEPVREKKKTFIDHMEDFASLKKRKRTLELYKGTINKLRIYDPECSFETMTKKWLIEFDNWMEDQGLSINTRAIEFRNIRSVFNYAIDEEITDKYPFRKFSIKHEETTKRSLSIDQLRELRTCQVEAWQEPYRDLFLLMYYLIGINMVDLFRLTKDNIVDGRIEYVRSKTGAHYSVLIQPEAQELLEKLGGGHKLVSMFDRYSDWRDATKHMNHALKLIGTGSRKGLHGDGEPLFPGISTNAARHSWATVGYHLGIPMQTISDALGHQYGSRVTRVYIKKDLDAVDEANRKVIEAIL